jgi:hypothetical protein
VAAVIPEPTASHLPLLERAALASHGLVIEHGAGLYSSPLLARLGRDVLCVEGNDEWRAVAASHYGSRVTFGSLADALAALPSAGLVFIDGAQCERARLLDAALSAGVPHIVAHDTHERCFTYYGWRPEHFAAPDYAVEHDVFKRKYRTTYWHR